VLLVLRPAVRRKDDVDHTADAEAFRLLLTAAGLAPAAAYGADALRGLVEVAPALMREIGITDYQQRQVGALMDFFRHVKGVVVVTLRDRKTPFTQ
jgi:hypothetical protein